MNHCDHAFYWFITKNAFSIKIIIKFSKLQQRTWSIFGYFFTKYAVTASINLSIIKILNILYLNTHLCYKVDDICRFLNYFKEN